METPGHHDPPHAEQHLRRAVPCCHARLAGLFTVINNDSATHKPSVLQEIPDSFGGKGEGYKTFKLYFIEDIFVNIHHKTKAIASQQVTYHSTLLWS